MLRLKQNTWISSDLHAFHKNIVRKLSSWNDGSTMRDFDSVDQMNDTIVNNINSVVKEEDLLICLGDWNFGGIQNLPIFRERIACRNIILVLGNHDGRHGQEFDPIVRGRRSSSYFKMYTQYLEAIYNDIPIIMFHYPIASWNHMGKGAIHTFGHIHSVGEARFFNGGKSMDVGLDGNNMMPYHIDEILSLMKDRPIKKEGHHA